MSTESVYELSLWWNFACDKQFVYILTPLFLNLI